MELERRKPTFKGSADWFTGDVYVDPLAQGQGPSPVSLGWVHFTPCAHTAWHRHSFGQTLCVTEGEGFVQARGGPLVREPGVEEAVGADPNPSGRASAERPLWNRDAISRRHRATFGSRTVTRRASR
jgi:quercetin dioxygenase-like cupin family protein